MRGSENGSRSLHFYYACITYYIYSICNCRQGAREIGRASEREREKGREIGERAMLDKAEKTACDPSEPFLPFVIHKRRRQLCWGNKNSHTTKHTYTLTLILTHTHIYTHIYTHTCINTHQHAPPQHATSDEH